jgi:CRP-like cAMP-binding protein
MLSEMSLTHLPLAELLRDHPILQGTGDSLPREILECGLVQLYTPGEFLSREGDPAEHYWLLCAGSVRVFYTSPDGYEVTVKIFSAPAAWAEMEVLTHHCHIEDCVAVDRTTVVKIARPHLENLLDAHPRFMRNILYDTSARFLIAAQHERALAFAPVSERLANLLLAYVRMYGVPVEGGVGIRIKLSQGDLARGLGVNKRSITRTLTEWQAEGFLSKRGQNYVILDLPQLEARASRDLVGIDWVAGSRMNEGKGTAPRTKTRAPVAGTKRQARKG